MDRFVVRSKRLSIASNGSSTGYENIDGNVGESSEKRARVDIKCEEDIISDPALRKPINEYDTEVRDLAREGYMARGPCQPFKHDFPRRDIGNKMRCFQIEWFHKWEWLEYSVSKDAAFCFWCCLFNGDIGKRFGDGVFVKTGFRNWKKATERFRDHEGVVGSTHNKARALFFAFRDQKESLTRNMSEEKQVVSDAHRSCLNASVDFIRLLLEQDLTFDSFAQQLTCPPIQKEYVSACASQTTKAIIAEIGHKCFSLLIGETRDSLKKEQMIVVLRYVNNYGAAVERFLGVFHAFDNTAPSLKSGIYDFFAEHGLSFSKVRGQGYDRTCNMRDYAQSRRRSRCALPVITWDQYFRVEIFCQVIDQIVQEMAIRFSEPNIELLTCIACLDPKNSFRNFRESKLLQLAELYPQDFSLCDRMELKEQLQIWICEMRSNEIFSDLQSIEDVAKKMVELGIHTCFHLVYRLIELVLVLPVVTASTERDFFAMSNMNTDLRNIMGDDFLSEWLVCFTEEDIFRSIDDEAIKQHFQNIGTREINLPLSV